MTSVLIFNGIIVTPNEAFPGAIWIDNRTIVGISRNAESPLNDFPQAEHAEKVNAQGCFVLPGLIDLHGDAFEKAIQPRKSVMIQVPLALRSLQSYLLSAGITTMFHSISFTGEPGIRSNDSGYSIAEEIVRLRESSDALLRHRIHVRYELVNSQGVTGITRMIDNGWVDLFSVMDHTPQYGKYKTLDEYRYYVEKTYQLTGEAREVFIEEQRAKREAIDFEATKQLMEHAIRRGITLCSHDDDTPLKLDEMKANGATVSEFPLNEQTAAYAIQSGMFAVVGGPNVLRGISHENNLSARHALKEGLANIICSDYYPYSMLAAVFSLVDEGLNLPQSVAYASLYPARAIGSEDKLGSLETGKQADLLLVRKSAVTELPQVVRAMVEGKWQLIHSC
ncbi:alpha-D-ribose 1-methylphosphonate 5-triphosphate diphosphatase [Paenibacillus sp. GP183]|uniref:alpha-D-ribose 1-methylphosphonate 5-triphosphate diphosphatase n=1 Tax=Paenibacillus sp. GP183 TaxID=1882751 RepID=UPI00089D00C1|nr:alpha-D-ribose 1-methylphosphonate 5-triphosphate diphosphatase [Paenibacillus sp. GP183]SEC62058.1 alpha-D-ribose 1-methylphosphonate 5-triphosphate diphosphatase [Paenibacillus sp. GP183]